MKDPRLKNVGEALSGRRKNCLIDDIVDKENLAIFLGRTEESITYYQKEYGLPFIPLGRDTYFSIKIVYRWLKDREVTLVPEKEGQKKKGMAKTSKGSKTQAI